MSILDFKKYKEEGRKFTYVTAYDYTMASIINDSETEVILVGDSLGMIMLGYDGTEAVTMEDMIHHTKSVVKGAPDTYIIGDMPFGSYNESTQQAIHNCTRLMKETGCDAIKLEGGAKYAELIKAIINAGIPVCGHIGLTPQTTTSLGGFKVQGGTPESARQLIEDAKAVTEAVSIPIMGIGAGPDVDCQVLVTQDLLGMYGNFKPKFVKLYAKLREEMVKALNEFHTETEEGAFPTEEYSFNKKVDING